MWYKYSFLKVTAGTKEEYLKSIGIDQSVIDFIISQEEKISNILTNHVRKNPSLTVVDLQKIIDSQSKGGPTELELAIANRYVNIPIFYNWLLVQLRKCRIKLPGNTGNFGYKFPNNITDISAEFALIYDWYRFNNIDNLHNYSLENAISQEKQWHEAINDENNEDVYLPTKKENIVYGPKWKNPEFEGWTIQKVSDPHDLKCEGNKMNHCVGRYSDHVRKGEYRIFSLRDPQNQPHITIGMLEDNTVFDYEGRGNSNPTDRYREMIKEWFLSLGDVKNESRIGYHEDYYDLPNTPENMAKRLEDSVKRIGKGFDEYGFINQVTQDDLVILETIIICIDGYNNSYFGFNRDIKQNLYDISKNILELYYLYSEKLLKDLALDPYNKSIIKKLKYDSLFGFMEDCYEKLNEYSDMFFESYESYYTEDEELTEEENEKKRDEIYNDYQQEYFKSNTVSFLISEIIDDFNKNPKYIEMNNKIYNIIYN